MKGIGDAFRAIEGMDENGKSKAICCLTIEKRYGSIRLKPEVQKFAYMQNANVKVSLIGNYTMVDLGFEGYLDDYLQILELCKDFNAMKDACESGKKPVSNLSLILTITLKEEYDFYLRGIDAAWSIIPEILEGMCNTIRFIFVKEKFGVYEIGRSSESDG